MEAVKDKNSILTDLTQRSKELTEKVAELRKSEEELAQINNAIKALGGTPYNKIANTLISVMEKISLGALTWPEKVKAIVAELGEATVQQIMTRMIEIDPRLTKEEIYNNVTTIASNMAGRGELVARKDGIKNVYSIPKK